MRIILIELILNTQICSRSRLELVQLIPEQLVLRRDVSGVYSQPCSQLVPLKPAVRLPPRDALAESRMQGRQAPTRDIMTHF